MNHPFTGLHHSAARASGTQQDVNFSMTVVSAIPARAII